MPLVFKLVGYTQDKKYFEIRDSFDGPVNLKLLQELFVFWGFSAEEFDKIKLITDSEQIKNPDKAFPVKNDEDRVIFVFTSDPDIRLKLQQVFIKEGTEVLQQNGSQLQEQQEIKINHTETFVKPVQPDVEICQPLTVKKVDPIPVITPELVELMNVKTVSLFSDPDFKNLISIYLRRPELFNTLAQYVQHGNVIEESLDQTTTLESLNQQEQSAYHVLAEKIQQLGISLDTHNIMGYLAKYKGHLNLTVRAILCDMAKTQ